MNGAFVKSSVTNRCLELMEGSMPSLKWIIYIYIKKKGKCGDLSLQPKLMFLMTGLGSQGGVTVVTTSK